MKSILQIALIIVLTSAFFVPHISQAQENDNVVDESEVTENLKSRLKETINEVSTSSTPTSFIGYIGTVKDVVKSTIIIEDKAGKKNVVTGEETNFVRTPGNSEIKLENVRIDDSIIAIGSEMDDSGEISAKKIIVSENPFTPREKLTNLGTIKEINKYSFTLETKTSEELELFFTGKTVYKSSSSSLELDDLNVGDTILFTAGKDKDNDWSATVIMQLKAAPQE